MSAIEPCRYCGYRTGNGEDGPLPPCCEAATEIGILEAKLATATEAAEAARDKALEEAIAEVTHVTSTAHDARVLALAAKRIELLRAKLRAAKEGR